MKKDNVVRLPKANGGSNQWELVPDSENSEHTVWEWNPCVPNDTDELFKRVEAGRGTALDIEHFDACMLQRFCERVDAGEPVEPWILNAISAAFVKVLYGGDWIEEIRLPGRKPKDFMSWRERRDFEIYIAVQREKSQKVTVTQAIQNAADANAMSYEAARKAYYDWKNRLSKNQS